MTAQALHPTDAYDPDGSGMRLDRPAEFLSGAAFSAFGISFACGASVFNHEAPAIHWTGAWLPLLAGLLIALTGNLIILKSLALWRLRARPLPSAGRALLGILLISGVFAAALGAWSTTGLPTIGLLGGIYIAGFTVWLAGKDVHPRTFAGLAAALAFGSYLAFVVALDLSLPVWPTFLHG